MGLFDSMLGEKAKESAQHPGGQERFGTLKAKYQSVLNLLEQKHVQLHNLHVEHDKLFIKGTAESDAVKNAIWDQVKLVDKSFSDLSLQLDVKAGAAGAGATATAPSMETYVVKSGDSLSKIAQHYYGDAKAYSKIFEANRDILSNPDLIQPGQTLKIPRA